MFHRNIAHKGLVEEKQRSGRLFAMSEMRSTRKWPPYSSITGAMSPNCGMQFVIL